MTTLTTHHTATTRSTGGDVRASLREAVQAITREAEAHGWTIRRVYRSRCKRSHYVKLQHADAGKLTVRASDHTPTRPVEGKARMLLHIIGVRGSLANVLQYLARPAA
ncbi:hypothetical protein ACERK3_16960 [Phycisphaerales bacterium AB-hyl4]|uniref:Uncharacterized protein n=1 Tax=Natronomicrosphaera hydrolytica TaxID=3242702 RepID=A0ABV4UAB7_9BACT